MIAVHEPTREEVEAAVAAWDAERCRQNESWHGGLCAPASPAMLRNVEPIIRAALKAAYAVKGKGDIFA